MGPGFWKLNTSILKDKAFRASFTKFWQRLIMAKVITQELWDDFKVLIKDFIIKFCKKKARADRAIDRDLRNEYYSLVRAENLSPGNFSEQIVNLKHRLNERQQSLFAGSKIRSKADTLDNAEKPSRFFYRAEYIKGSKKKISKIVDIDNIECTSADDISTAFQDFYASLFTSGGIDGATADEFTRDVPVLTKEDADSCDGLITLDELRTALFLMKNDKSPGSDGICKEFYVTFFDLVGDVLCSVLNLSFSNCSMSSSQRLSYISLLCKDAENATALTNWRPISLCNVDYKCMSKVMCLRLGNVLSSLVHVDQTCSVKGRSIFDNVHLLRNVLDYCEQKDLKCAFVSLDMMKAFDRVEYGFMYKCLQAYGFGKSFMSWVRVFYTNISSSVITNGHISFPFPVTRGVRQGCALSPLLYVLCLEPLLIRIRANTDIVGLSLPGTMEDAKASGYADDVTGIVTTEASVGHLLDTCTQYGLASGSKLNMGKTKGLWIGRWQFRNDQPAGLVWGKKNQNLRGLVRQRIQSWGFLAFCCRKV
jgi:hypothetical protein